AGAHGSEAAALKSVLEGFVLLADQSPLGQAAVTLIEQKTTVKTSPEGYYQFPNLATGDYVVEAALDGYVTKSAKAHVEEGYSTLLNFTLEAAVVERPEAPKIEDWAGQVACSFMVAEDPETGVHQDCGSNVPGDARTHDFTVMERIRE